MERVPATVRRQSLALQVWALAQTLRLDQGMIQSLDLDPAQRRVPLALRLAMDLSLVVLNLDLAMVLAMDLLTMATVVMDLLDLVVTTPVMAMTTLTTTMENSQLPNHVHLRGRCSNLAWLMVEVILWVECQ